MSTLRTEIARWLASRRRLLNLLIGLGAVALYEILRVTYRPYVYANGIHDFHLADTLGNSLGTMATVFVFASVLGRDLDGDYFLIRTVTISVAVYELAHPLLGKPIDPFDLVATLVAGLFCEWLERRLHGLPPEPNAR